MKSYLDQIEEARQFLAQRFKKIPKLAVVLGSGLGDTTQSYEVIEKIPYPDIPYFPKSTVVGHSGELILAQKNSLPILFMKGRVHYYEGYSPWDVVFPVRLLARLGVDYFVLTNASGGLDPSLCPPHLALITDHVNAMGMNPLIGPNMPELGERFPDMSEPYDRKMGVFIREAYYQKYQEALPEGIYLGISGPSFETPAEIKLYQALGIKWVGMSTVPETIALRHMKKKVVGISCVANLGCGLTPHELTHEEVLTNSQKITLRLSYLIEQIQTEWN